MRPLDVGVIGCGTAGSAAALFLARAGHRVTVYERVPDPGPVGAGITLQPTGLHVLRRLGLAEHILARGAPIDRLVCLTRGRRTVVDLAYAEIAPGLAGLGLHLGVLFEALLGAVRREPAIRCLTGIEIVDLARERRPGRALVDRDGERHGSHDLVVVADGARSQLRDDTQTSSRIEPYPWGALWFVARDTRPRDDPATRTLHQVVDGNATFLGLLPTGRPPASEESILAASDPLVSVFWSVRADRVGALRAAGLEKWKSEVLALAPEAEPFLEPITDVRDLLFAAYHDVVMHRWNTRDVVYLGDAAHATSPQLGQGCNLALWDAMVLADVLAEEPHDLARALDRYSRTRKDHLAFYQVATRWLTPFFQGDEPALGALRDLAMPIAQRVPPLRRLMTRAMIGVVEGFVGGSVALDLAGPSVAETSRLEA